MGKHYGRCLKIEKCYYCKKEYKPTAAQKHYYKKHPNCRKYCSLNCYHKDKSGERNPKWRGGVTINDGYSYIYRPGHPYATKKGYVLEHRLVMESILGRYLKPEESVHHIDGVKLNNKPENLMLMESEGEHRKLHAKYRTRNNRGFYGHVEGVNLYL